MKGCKKSAMKPCDPTVKLEVVCKKIICLPKGRELGELLRSRSVSSEVSRKIERDSWAEKKEISEAISEDVILLVFNT